MSLHPAHPHARHQRAERAVRLRRTSEPVDIVRERPPHPDVFARCNHHPAFGERCDQPGTWRTQDRWLERMPNGLLRWPQQRWWTWCDEHRDERFHERIETT